MRRAFSALFGRFFARAYLETYHGFTWFAAIDGDNFLCPPNFRVRRKRGAHTEMPDWLCGGPGGLVAIAEAKGSHQRGNAGGHGKPVPSAPRKDRSPGFWFRSWCRARGNVCGSPAPSKAGP